jgi:uncharacterized protein (DUF952 family)
VILHIIARADWVAARAAGAVRPPSLAEVGFVHCSDPGTVHLPAGRLYAGRRDLLLLELDPARLGAEVRWEPGDEAVPESPWYPHVYGPLDVSAVVAVHDFPPAAGGGFRLPPALAVRDRAPPGPLSRAAAARLPKRRRRR